MLSISENHESILTLNEHIVFSTDAAQINSPAFHDCIVHLVCIEGEAVLSVSNRFFEISKGQIAVLAHPRNVAVVRTSDNFSCEFITAPAKFLHNMLPPNNYSIQGSVSLFANPIMDVEPEEAERFRTDLANIRRRINDTGHRFYTEMISSLLQTMVYDLFDFHARLNENVLTTNRVGYVTSQFFTLIAAGRTKTHRNVSYYAGLLHVSPKYLSETIKRVTGESVLAHINRAATNIIIDYLKNSALSVSQIADEMNFASLSYFSRYCLKHIGRPPSAFRTAGSIATP